MRVAIVQLPARFVEDATLAAGLRSMALILEAISAEKEETDLVVFPENFPASGIHACAREDELAGALARLHTGPSLAFMAGGYVIDAEGATRNACFLINEQRCVGTYHKRIRWQEEAIEPGKRAAMFRWKKGAKDFEIFPLICADVCEAGESGSSENPSVDEAWPAEQPPAARKINDSCVSRVVVVTTYGADLRHPYWTKPLRALVKRTGVPVVVCGVSGESLATFWEGKRPQIERHYGGGGSGVYFPDDSDPPRVWPEDLPGSSSRGIYLIDIKQLHARSRIAIPDGALRIGSIQY